MARYDYCWHAQGSPIVTFMTKDGERDEALDLGPAGRNNSARIVNRLGEESWELVSVDSHRWYFKRDKKWFE